MTGVGYQLELAVVGDPKTCDVVYLIYLRRVRIDVHGFDLVLRVTNDFHKRSGAFNGGKL